MTTEPTVLVPMTRAMRDVVEFIGESYGVVPKADREVALALMDAYDAAAARPAEPGRCEARHDSKHIDGLSLRCTRQRDHLGEHVWGDPLGGVVGGGA